MRNLIILASIQFKELLRKKDFYVFLVFLLGLLFFFYQESFFNVTNVSRYMKDIGLSLVTLFSVIITIVFSAKQIPAELESRTIYPLLAKPVSRADFVLGKFAGSFLISAFSFTVFYALYVVMVTLKAGSISLAMGLQAYILFLCMYAILSAFSILFSLFLTLSANISLVFLLYFLISWYNGILRSLCLKASGAKAFIFNAAYYILPHFEFFDTRIRIVHGWPPIPLWVLSSIVVYSLIYTAVLLWAAISSFNKKSL